VTDLRILPAGDAALLVEMPSRIDPVTSDLVLALARGIRGRCGAAARDVVVGYCSVTIYFDPLVVDIAWLESEVRAIHDALPRDVAPPCTVHDVPVCYEREFAPDLDEVAAFGGLSAADVALVHASVTYRVYVIGFMPGFAYMATVDPRLALPRRASPRTHVPPGSVAIAAGQTAIYPIETPGGWHLIGRTNLKPFDPFRAEPFLFSPGDQVRFRAVSRAEFERA